MLPIAAFAAAGFEHAVANILLCFGDAIGLGPARNLGR
jgi:formate/nitrite transporter FocA (FNT family)